MKLRLIFPLLLLCVPCFATTIMRDNVVVTGTLEVDDDATFLNAIIFPNSGGIIQCANGSFQTTDGNGNASSSTPSVYSLDSAYLYFQAYTVYDNEGFIPPLNKLSFWPVLAQYRSAPAVMRWSYWTTGTTQVDTIRFNVDKGTIATSDSLVLRDRSTNPTLADGDMADYHKGTKRVIAYKPAGLAQRYTSIDMNTTGSTWTAVTTTAP